jgi:hypothetical protein
VLTRRYSDDARAWAGLAFTRAVYNWAQGRSPGEAREPLQRALALETPLPQLVNLAINVAKADRRTDGLRGLIPRAIKDANGRGATDGARVFVAFAEGDPGARDTLRRVLDEGDEGTLAFVGNALAKSTDSLHVADEVWRRYRDRWRADVGGVYLAANHLARGRWRDGRTEFGRVTQSILGTTVPAWYAAVPFFQRPESELHLLRDSLRSLALPDTQLGIRAIGLFIRPALNPWAREYIVGLLSARLGDRRDATRRAEALEAATLPPDSSDIRRDLALEIRALLALEAGDDSSALQLLEQQSMRLGEWWDVNSMFHRRPFGRFLRAELLARSGRNGEALNWYGTFTGPFWGHEFVLFAPAYVRIGELHERSGNRRQAIEYFQRFVARWRHADPEYQSLVQAVEARIARLRGQR